MKVILTCMQSALSLKQQRNHLQTNSTGTGKQSFRDASSSTLSSGSESLHQKYTMYAACAKLAVSPADLSPAITDVGDIPYEIIRPILIKLENPEQLVCAAYPERLSVS